MKPLKIGQIVKFHSPLPDEDPNQLYVIVEVADDSEAGRATIQPINYKLKIAPLLTVKISDLQEVKVSATEMIGETVHLQKNDGSEVSGRVVSARDSEIFLEMTKNDQEIITNCQLTIIDRAGLRHEGFYVFKA